MTPDVISLLVYTGLALLYIAPAMIASSRGARSQGGIVAVNLLLGWTIVGWWIAIIWALAARPMKACPHCARAVPAEASVCSYCRGALASPVEIARHANPQTVATTVPTSPRLPTKSPNQGFKRF